MIICLIKLLTIWCAVGISCQKLLTNRTFPSNFLFGVATSSYQIEGGYNEGGKSLSIWDYATHTVEDFIKDNSNGDVACDSYHNIARDVEMIRELGVDYYRFSLSWPRILPSGFDNIINEEGINYYSKLIDELLKYNIKPVATLYHWDLPQSLQDLGGWTNPLIVQWFEDYARVVYKSFGDSVKHWITINEPLIICQLGYGEKIMAPRVNSHGIGTYLCSRNVLLAHAKAWRLYDEQFRETQNGINGITVSVFWHEPASDKETDNLAAKEMTDFDSRQFIDPIFSETGDYPVSMRKRIDARSKEQRYTRSRLPKFTNEEIKLIRGTSDFLGINHYTSYITFRNESVPYCNLETGTYQVPSYMDDVYAATAPIPGAIQAAANWLYDIPEGFYSLLIDIKVRYNNPPIYITENGFTTHGGLHDDSRVHYMRGYLNALLDAMDTGCDVRGYTFWSLMDNFEWTSGYIDKMGLYEVDFGNINRTRTARKSALVYKHIVKTHQIDPNYEPKTLDISIDK